MVVVLVAALVAVSLGTLPKDVPPVAGATSTPSPTPTPTATPIPDPAIGDALMALQAAYNAGNVQAVCRPGKLIDPAVIPHLHQIGVVNCEADVEHLLSTTGNMDIAVRSVQMRPDLATAMVSPAGATAVGVDLVRHGERWLISFSNGGDPLQAMAGA
jgi:hypothetical protein